MNLREQQLHNWVLAKLPPQAQPCRWTSVAGDASSRRYFRLRGDELSVIAVDSPPATEKNSEFLLVRQLLADHGVPVPALHAVDGDRGFLLLGDLGDELLLDHLDEASVDHWYKLALKGLLNIQSIGVTGGQIPDYSDAVLSEELERFGQWFCSGLLGVTLPGSGAALLEDLQQQLVSSALEQPQVLVHRDYHSRNLLPMGETGLGVIDFQDALRGPLCYDLVSLLKDCYIVWPRSQVLGWLADYRGMCLAAGSVEMPSLQQLIRWFDWIGLQRHLKVLGNFSRLALRDSRPDYLPDLPRVLDYIRQVIVLYPEFEDFAGWFDAELEPRIRKQAWYSAA